METRKLIAYALVAAFPVAVLGAGSGYAADKLIATHAQSADLASAQRASCPKRPPPRVIELFYINWYEGQSLTAFARRTHRLRFRTAYRGKTAVAPAYDSGAEDFDLHGRYKGWEPIRHEGGQKVIRDVRLELRKRGVARVHTVAKRCGRTDDHLWTIVLAKCSQDPSSGVTADCTVRRRPRY